MVQESKAAMVIARGHEEEPLPKRFSNKDEESTLLEYVVDAVWTVTDEILIILSSEPSLKLVESLVPIGAKIIVEKGSELSNIITGFKSCTCDYVFVVRENMPFVKPNVIHFLFECIRGYDAAIPKWKVGSIEPRLAVYRRKAILKAFEEELDSLEALINELYAVNYVSVEDDLAPLDPDLTSFFKVNTKEDLQKAKEIVMYADVRGVKVE
jgi:molybdopterin-guanine dinucleotide biosynthesis protein A